jgi:hypothetical protein
MSFEHDPLNWARGCYGRNSLYRNAVYNRNGHRTNNVVFQIRSGKRIGKDAVAYCRDIRMMMKSRRMSGNCGVNVNDVLSFCIRTSYKISSTVLYRELAWA